MYNEPKLDIETRTLKLRMTPTPRIRKMVLTQYMKFKIHWILAFSLIYLHLQKELNLTFILLNFSTKFRLNLSLKLFRLKIAPMRLRRSFWKILNVFALYLQKLFINVDNLNNSFHFCRSYLTKTFSTTPHVL